MHPLYYTADGTLVDFGLRVWTNNLQRGTIRRQEPQMLPDPWWTVDLDDGGTELQNAERMTVRHPFNGEAA